MARDKCKVCGYRFKYDDGPICPECLSSREETMTCETYSDGHSHDEAENTTSSIPEYRQYRHEKENKKAKKQSKISGPAKIIIIFIIIFFGFQILASVFSIFGSIFSTFEEIFEEIDLEEILSSFILN